MPERIGLHAPAAWQHGSRKTLSRDVFVLSSGCRQKRMAITTPALTHRGVTHSWGGMPASHDTCLGSGMK